MLIFRDIIVSEIDGMLQKINLNLNTPYKKKEYKILHNSTKAYS